MSLLASLSTAANALDVFEQAMGVIQSNVTNANTAGYAKQTLNIEAMPFQPNTQLWGGVTSAGLESSRNRYAEQAVWSQNQLLGNSTQMASSLSSLQTIFDVSGSTGVPAALNKLYSAFSAWSSSPSDITSRQQVISAAQGFSQQMTQTFNNVTQLRAQTDDQLGRTVSQINAIADQIASINDKKRAGLGDDAGLDSQLFSNLEKLSSLVPVTIQDSNDGSVSVLMGGQIPLVLGSSSFHLSVAKDDFGPSGIAGTGVAPDVRILDKNGQDVTAIVSAGQLAAQLEFRNFIIPSVVGNWQQQGSLNQLAQAVADRVNALLTSGQVSVGPPPVSGSPLLYYTPGSPNTVAGTLALDPAITAASLAAIDAAGTANGIASQLAGLANPTNQADMVHVSGATYMSYTDFYSSFVSDIGAKTDQAAADRQTQTQSLTQAQNMRSQLSGVSLDDQAAQLMQFQQAYEASARFISIINSITEDFMQTVG